MTPGREPVDSIPVGDAHRGEREWLESFAIRPKKKLGQNFLLDASLTREIVRRASWAPDLPILEIGAGGGALTAALLQSGRTVTAVEIDPRLLDLLRVRFAEEITSRRLLLFGGDILGADLMPPMTGGQIPSDRTRRPWVCGNLPYGITTPCLKYSFSRRAEFAGAVFMVQREYGARLLAHPGSRAYGSLTVWTAAHAIVRPLIKVGRSCFWPRPGVESVVVELLFPDPLPYPGDLAALERVLRAAFGQRRKTLENALAHGLGLDKETARAAVLRAGCDPSFRAEVLSLDQFAQLTAELGQLPSAPSPS